MTPLINARAALTKGDFPTAARLAEPITQTHPTTAEAHFILGMALAETGHVAHALGRVAQATTLSPTTAEYAAQHARLLILLRRDADAATAATRAAALPSDDPLVLDTIGCVHARLGDHAAALPLFARATAAAPDNLSFRFNHASSLGFFGRTADAATHYEAMLAIDPANGPAHYGLANLTRQTPETTARIEAALPLARTHETRVQLHYAAAKAHEDLGHPAQTFAHLSAANSAHKTHIAYRPDPDAAIAAALQSAFQTPTYFTGAGDPTHAPIFVVGLPRTGTTLVDRILAAHPAVQSLGELQAMPLALKRLAKTPSRLVLDPETIAAAAQIPPRAVAEAYLTQANAQSGVTNNRRILDKFPLNFLYIGHIARALPNARIVCLRRHPLDSVWSNYKHMFALNSPYYGWSYDLLDTARYYALFDRLMAFWAQQFPGRVLSLGYETLIENQQTQTEHLLTHCGLTWHEGCLDFHRTTAAVATPSAQQVRRPLNRDSIGRWRDHAAALAPVIDWFTREGIAIA